MNAMPEERPRSQKTELALAIASGASVAAWARGHQVLKQTASRWAGEPQVRATVESDRHRATHIPQAKWLALELASL
jgi:hypothetical protein